MHLSTHPTSYPTRYQEIAAKTVRVGQHFRWATILPPSGNWRRLEVNRHTLRRAVDQLVEKGWVQRRRRRRAGADAPVRLPADAQA